MQTDKNLQKQLEIAAWIYEEAFRSTGPLDRYLAGFFHRNRGRYGSKARRVISNAVFGMFRHKLLIEGWMKRLGSDSKVLPMLCALVCEGLIDEGAFSAAAGAETPGELFRALGAREPAAGSNTLSPSENLSERYSFPLWIVEIWEKLLGPEETAKLLDAMNRRAPLVVRANPLRTTRDALVELLRKSGHEASPTPLSPWGIRIEKRFNIPESGEFKEGLFEIQDEGSQMAVLALDPKPEEVVWDACAGGGGKTLFIAALMKNQGRVLASDVRAGKLEELRKRAKRAGLFNIFPADDKKILESQWIVPGVDRILIDAPCSGTGTFRRNPDGKWRLTDKIIVQFQENQLRILEHYSSYLKPGGVLVYATCSLQHEENETVVDIFLKGHPEFARAGGDLRLFPHRHGTDGFYVAKLIRSRQSDLKGE